MKSYEEIENLMKHPIIASDFVGNIFHRDIFSMKNQLFMCFHVLSQTFVKITYSSKQKGYGPQIRTTARY